MNGPRVQVTLPSGKEVRGTLIGPAHSHGPSDVLVDGTWPSRPVDRADWEFLPITYRCVFDRVGRTHDVAPLTVEVRTADELAEAVYGYARPHLGSRNVQVLVNLVEMSGLIVVGDVRPGGSFTISTVEPEPAVRHA